MTTEVLAAEGLGKTYPSMTRPALRDVTFTVGQGEIVGLLGPNGAGKTTLVKLVCGVTSPTDGRISVLGRPPDADHGQIKRHISAVHQSGPFDNMLPVIDNLKIAASFRGLRWSRVRDRVEGMLADFGLADRAGQLAFTLSGGEQRRVQVVRALIDIPRLLLLDEPSAGLDVEGRRHVWELITKLVAEHGTTVLWTSHYTEELERHCGTVLILDRGRLVRHTEPASLVAEYGRASVSIGVAEGTDREHLVMLLCRVDGVQARVTDSGVEVTGQGIDGKLPLLFSLLRKADQVPTAVSVHTPSLEDAFVALVERTED